VKKRSHPNPNNTKRQVIMMLDERRSGYLLKSPPLKGAVPNVRRIGRFAKRSVRKKLRPRKKRQRKKL